jgi:hypothetical protein
MDTAAAGPYVHQHRCTQIPAHRHRLHRRLHRPRHDHTDRHLTEVRAVGRVRRPAAVVEPHLTVHTRQQRRLESSGVDRRRRIRAGHRRGQIDGRHGITSNSA